MASHTLPPPDFGDSDLMNYAVRMVIPLRREFGTTLDVPHFLHDFTYAREIIEQAKSSQDPRLREYAGVLDAKLFGPRNGLERRVAAPQAAAPAGAPPTAPAAGPAAEPAVSESELLLRRMNKYRSGLR